MKCEEEYGRVSGVSIGRAGPPGAPQPVCPAESLGQVPAQSARAARVHAPAHAYSLSEVRRVRGARNTAAWAGMPP